MGFKTFLFFSIIFSKVTASYGTSYYLSNSGNDNNNGLSPHTAWSSISKLNSEMLKISPGDQILFQRGSVFSGQINITISGDKNYFVIFGAYGTGENPVIKGSIPIKDWVVHQRNIFKATTDTVIHNLLVNGRQKILARYPNSGFLTIKEPLSNPKIGFVDSELKHPPGYWTGSNVRLRTTNWSYEYSSIKNFANGAITFYDEIYYPALSGWGYYLDNSINELDTAGEWYFLKDSNSNGILYYYPPEKPDLNEQEVEGSVFDFGFYSQTDLTNIIIENLDIRYQTNSGIYFIGHTTGIKIDNCIFSGQIQGGINSTGGAKGIQINNCRFNGINGKAIYLLSTENSIISNNTFQNIGMVPGYGTTRDAFGMSAIIGLESNSNHIFKNSIDSVGHDGINFIGNSNLVEKNIITNSLLMLNDGASIKSYGLNTRNSVLRNNFIFNSLGNLDATPKDNKIGANGIYLDAFCNNMEITNNTISYCLSAGIFLYDSCINNLINKNVCYGNNIGMEFYQGTEPMIDNEITQNILMGLNPGQLSLQLIGRTWDFIPGKFDSNYYYNPDIVLFKYIAGKNFRLYDINKWKTMANTRTDVGYNFVQSGEALNPKLLMNMSDSILYVIPDSGYYKDLESKDISRQIILEPWSSKVFFVKSDISILPELNVFNGSLCFPNFYEKNSSYIQWFQLIGTNLNETVTITAPEGFTLSFRNDINFSNAMSINPLDGKVSEVIYVKFTPSSEKDYTDFIYNTSGSLTSTVKVSGSVR